MSRFFVGLALWALLLALAACGGDSKITDPARDTELADDSLTESILDKDSDSAKDAEPGEKVNAVVPTFDDLLACTRDHEGATAYVEDEDSAYVCKKGLWVVDDSLTKAVRPDSEKKSSSSAKAKSSSNETSDSSSRAKSSSSKDGKSNSSSSSVVPLGCKTEAGDNCEYGTLTDDRDGQTYKTVKIGEQWWMAENLNYAYTDVLFKYDSYTSDSTSWCYDNDAANCAKYGRLYTWAAAMDSVGTWSTNGMGCGYYMECSPTNPVRGICPEGWHLPDATEWNALFDAVGGKATAGIMLKSTEGWNDKDDGTSGNGTDAYSFSELPAGGRDCNGNFLNEGNNAFFWSSTEDGSNYAYDMYLGYNGDGAGLYDSYKSNGFSVRCLKDYGLGSEKKSSNGKSSSSEKNSSSSSVVPLGCKTEAGDNCEYGTLTDDRDGQTYKTVKIGEQWWMAENLNYAYTDVLFKYDSYTSDSTSWCYDNDAANCAKYGRLYTWAAAMDSVGTWSTNGMGCGYYMECSPTNPVRGICPEGWHLPDTTEWNALFDAVGGKVTAGIMLKSTEGWISNGNGSDAYSFSALPAGYRSNLGNFYNEGYYANFWSSTAFSSIRAYLMYLGYDDVNALLDDSNKHLGFSVRCLKD